MDEISAMQLALEEAERSPEVGDVPSRCRHSPRGTGRRYGTQRA